MATTLSDYWVGVPPKPRLGPGFYIHGNVDGPTATDDMVLAYLEHTAHGSDRGLCQAPLYVLHGGTSFTVQFSGPSGYEGAVDGADIHIRIIVLHANFTVVSNTQFASIALWDAVSGLVALVGSTTADLSTVNAKLDQVLASVGTAHHNAA